jgi:hypothetical protein
MVTQTIEVIPVLLEDMGFLVWIKQVLGTHSWLACPG